MDDVKHNPYENLYEVMQGAWTADFMMERLGYRKVEGVGWVWPDSLWDPLRSYDRPFTKKQARRHAWEIRRRRWRNRLRDYKRRIVEAWRVLRGEDICEECW